MIFENVREVEVRAVNGHIRLKGWEREHVEVDYTPHGEVDVEVEEKDGKLIIREEPKKRFLNLLRKEGWAEIEVSVPKAVVVSAETVNGELRAENVRFAEATTVNGELDLKDCEAKLITTVNGRAKADLSTAGPLKATTVNGRMVLEIEELEGDVEVASVNGNLVVRLSDFCDARVAVSRFNGTVRFVGIDPEEPVIGAGTYTVRVSTVNGGGVSVELV